MASTSRVNDKIDETLKELTNLKIKYKRLRNSRETDKEDMESQIKKCKDDYAKFRKKIDETLKTLDEKFSKEVTDMEEKMTKEIDNHVTKIDNVLIKIKSLKQCTKSMDDDVIFGGAMELNSIKSEYETVLQESYPFQIDFKPNDTVTDLLKLKSLGALQIKKRRYTCIDVGSMTVYDCTFIGDSHLVLACGDDGLKLLDEHFKVQSQLDVEAFRVAAINNHEVVITQEQKKIQFVSISPEMAMDVTRTLDHMDRNCFGVYVQHDNIYVACHDKHGNGEVQVLDIKGITKRRLGIRGGTCMFRWPTHVTVSKDESKIFISDVETNTVTCLSQQGYEYTDIMLVTPTGLYLDDQDTLLVCGFNSRNVQEIKDNGRMQRIVDLFSPEGGVLYPECISRRPHDGYMVVGLWNAEKALVVFQHSFPKVQEAEFPCMADCDNCSIMCRDPVKDTKGQKEFDVPVNVNCREKNVVYAISCKICKTVLYVGETEREVRGRMREHIQDVRRQRERKSLIYRRHFRRENHSAVDVRFTILQQMYEADKKARQRHESAWIHRLQTHESLSRIGCNVKPLQVVV